MQKDADTVEAPKASPKVRDAEIKMLDPTDVSRHWDAICASIVEGQGTNNPQTSKAITNVMGAVMDGRIQVWAIFARTEDASKFIGAVTTQVITDAITETKSLYIYSMYASQYVTLEAWERMFEPIKAFAEENECTRIGSVTANERAAQVGEHLGFERQHFMVWRAGE